MVLGGKRAIGYGRVLDAAWMISPIGMPVERDFELRQLLPKERQLSFAGDAYVPGSPRKQFRARRIRGRDPKMRRGDTMRLIKQAGLIVGGLVAVVAMPHAASRFTRA